MGLKYYFDGDVYLQEDDGVMLSLETNADGTNSLFDFYRSKGSAASKTAVTSGQTISIFRYFGHDGSTYQQIAGSSAHISAISGTDVAGELRFYTHKTGDSVGTTTERVRIEEGGELLLSDGSASLPALSFLSDVDTGIYYGSSAIHFGVGGGSTMNVQADALRMLQPLELSSAAYIWIEERPDTPASPAQSSQVNIYMRGDNLIFQYDDAGTVRYYYIDLTGGSGTWLHTTTPP